LFYTENWFDSAVFAIPNKRFKSAFDVMLFCLRALSQPSLASCEAEVLA